MQLAAQRSAKPAVSQATGAPPAVLTRRTCLLRFRQRDSLQQRRGMNLIGHYVCAAACAPEARAGAALPDLAALYRRKVRPRALVAAWRDACEAGEAPEGLPALLAGVEYHHAVDVEFHRAPLFSERAAAIQAVLLEASNAPGLKRFLPAHVLCELYLDHLLLRRDPGLGAAFYQDMGALRPLLTTFVARHPAAEGASFARFLDHIVEERFVDAYHSHEGILGRMNRILARFGQRTLGPAEQGAVARWFREAERETERELERFLARMRPLAPGVVSPPVQPNETRGRKASGWAAGRLAPQSG